MVSLVCVVRMICCIWLGIGVGYRVDVGLLCFEVLGVKFEVMWLFIVIVKNFLWICMNLLCVCMLFVIVMIGVNFIV